jgi:N6-adenosine-specific RNA methylase IME4
LRCSQLRESACWEEGAPIGREAFAPCSQRTITYDGSLWTKLISAAGLCYVLVAVFYSQIKISKMKKYDVIYADPAWRYDFSKSNSREIENQYPTMTIDEICALKVPSKDNAVLYMWATAPKLLEAIKVLNAWGFEYKTQAVWDKEIIGMGYWFRGQHEILIVATKGKFSPPEQPLRISSVIKEKRTKHSKKPIYVRDMIEKWFPNAERLEMFARTSGENWDVWGNEVVSDVVL